MSSRTHHELRCFCSRQPLLATYGVDEKGRLYIHQKSFKQKRIYSESIVYSGEIRLHCRDCLRWQTVIMIAGNVKPELAEGPPPPELEANID